MSTLKTMDERETTKNCNHPWTWMMVSADGGVKPCCWAPGSLGNLNHSTPEVIWNGPLAQELRATILKNQIHPICANASCKYVINMSEDKFQMNAASKEVGNAMPQGDSPQSNPAPHNEWSQIHIAQLASISMTRYDVQAAFRLFLNRDPRGEEEIAPFLGVSGDVMLSTFLSSKEFINRREMVGPMVFVANKFLGIDNSSLLNPQNSDAN